VGERGSRNLFNNPPWIKPAVALRTDKNDPLHTPIDAERDVPAVGVAADRAGVNDTFSCIEVMDLCFHIQVTPLAVFVSRGKDILKCLK